MTGLHEIADGVWAWIARTGTWGWSNAGLVVDGGESLLVDTLFDLKLTTEMLDAMRKATPAAAEIDTVVNTHANGDHCYGNQLVGGARIVASRRSAEEMEAVPPSLLAEFMRSAPQLGLVGEFLQEIFGAFDFDGIELVAPTELFEGALSLKLGGRRVELYDLGPAHTAGDVIVHLPDDGVVFTGDLLFHGGHPIVWAGPVRNWLEACDRILALDAHTVVPGHGPLAGPSAVEDQRAYFAWLVAEGTPRLQGGMSPLDAARDLAGGPYAGWGEGERLVANLLALWRDLGGVPADDVVTVLTQMAELSRGSHR